MAIKVNQNRIDVLMRHAARAWKELDELEDNEAFDGTGNLTEEYLMEYDLAVATVTGLQSRIGELYVWQLVEVRESAE